MTETHDRHTAVCDDCGVEDETASGVGLRSILSRSSALKIFTPISGVLLLLAFVSSYSLPQTQFATLFYFLSLASGSVFVLQGAIRGLIKQRFLNISFLVVLASIGAIYIGEYAEAAVVVFLFSLAEFFESYGVERSRRAVAALIEKSPKVARLKNGDTMPVEKVVVGTIVVVKPGEQIPLDGVVIKGESTIDEASITGESIPVDKTIDDQVFASTMNVQGYLEIKVEKTSQDSTFARIITLIEEAQASRAPTQAFIDKFARYYTPAVVILSILIAVVPTLVFGLPFEEWLYRALILLVIACPCALVIATPVAIASAIGGASRSGILIKGGKYLEKLAGVKAVAFDKTRTLTYGNHTVTDVITFGSHSKEKVIADAAGIELFSSHPLAEAIVAYAEEHDIKPHKMDSYQNVAGKGGQAQCLVCEADSYIGNRKLLTESGIDSAAFEADVERLEKEGKTVVLVAEGKEVIGALAISDQVREEAKDVVTTLGDQGVESVMLTGDNEHSATYIANLVGVTDVKASLLPEEKVTSVKKLRDKYHSVAMVGDGVNDAPSLVTSDVGFAIGAGGTDAAIESADITLLSGDLRTIPQSVRLARAAVKTIRTNIALALGIKILFLVLVPFGLTNLVFAIAADSGMAIVVILNSLRLFAVK
tara:strand:+ start:6928 stop:8883 length:1956 start_codon:yes stop_codon:yes gene_type:complete